MGYTKYQTIDGLIVLGPKDIGAMVRCRLTRENPTKIKKGWFGSIPKIPWTIDQMQALADLCKGADWQSVPVLWPAKPYIGVDASSMRNQAMWWGGMNSVLRWPLLGHDRWFMNASWAKVPITPFKTWKIGYLKPPIWSRGLSFLEQQCAAQEMGVTIADVPNHIFLLIVAVSTVSRGYVDKFSRAVTDIERRTSTIDERGHLSVKWQDSSFGIGRFWPEEKKSPWIGAAIEGLPSCLR